MMRAYVYRAALYCEGCGERIIGELAASLAYENDSEWFPQGPHPNGGGGADTPQHCDSCGVFLENPLTADGVEYVREAIAYYVDRHGYTGSTTGQWAEFYGLEAVEGAR